VSARPTSATPSLLADATGWLAYTTLGSSGDQVHLVRTDGSHDHAIDTGLPGRTTHADFSRDGRWIAFDQLTSENAKDRVYVGPVNGTHFHQVAPCAQSSPSCLDMWEPAWSPNGSQLVVSESHGKIGPDGPARFGLAVIDLASNRVTLLLDHPNHQGQDHFARWSPDGKTLVFWREQPTANDQANSAVFRINTDGSGLKQLTPWSMLADDPDWSPDGKHILFTTRPLLDFGAGRSNLYLMRPDGTSIGEITHYPDGGDRATQPRFTPDGKAIVYVHTGPSGTPRTPWAIRPDGTGNSPVFPPARPIYTHPALQPS
jgi:Tol biopolymer transport system component